MKMRFRKRYGKKIALRKAVQLSFHPDHHHLRYVNYLSSPPVMQPSSPNYFSQVEHFDDEVLATLPMPGDSPTLSGQMNAGPSSSRDSGNTNADTIHLGELCVALFMLVANISHSRCSRNTPFQEWNTLWRR